MHKRSSLAAVVAATALALAFNGQSAPAQTQTNLTSQDQETFPECYDDRGHKAVYFDRDDIVSGNAVITAGARYLKKKGKTFSNPAILYAPKVLANHTPIQRNFIMAHECYHLSSGDAREAYRLFYGGYRYTKEIKQKAENDADCYAAKSVSQDGEISEAELESLRKFVFKKKVTEKREKRWEHVQSCLNTDYQIISANYN